MTVEIGSRLTPERDCLSSRHPEPDQEACMGHLLWMAIVGLVVGAIARFILPGEQKMGWILTGLLGIGGSLVAGYVGQALGMYAVGQPAGWIASVVGALVLLFVVQKLRSRTPTQ
jgi:uncharacterized membrane protein YeaQ/YmgE (transglycosylase-associated protein family)